MKVIIQDIAGNTFDSDNDKVIKLLSMLNKKIDDVRSLILFFNNTSNPNTPDSSDSSDTDLTYSPSGSSEESEYSEEVEKPKKHKLARVFRPTGSHPVVGVSGESVVV